MKDSIDTAFKEADQKSTLKQVKIAVFIICLFSLSVFLGYLFGMNNKAKAPSSVQLPTPAENKLVSPTTPIPPEGIDKQVQLVLKRKTPTGDEVVYTTEDILNNKLARWKNNIFYGSKDYVQKVQIFSHDMTTGKTTAIYEETEDGYVRVSDLKVINNTLFFSVGDRGIAHTYWLDLPIKNQPQEVLGSDGYMIKKIGKDYWLLDGYGDGCGSYATYSLLNLETKVATPKVRTSSGCGGSVDDDGSFIGIDQKNNIILSEHLFIEPIGDQYINIVSGDQYLNIVSMPVSDPSAKTELLSKKNMPLGIKRILYSDEQNKLFLTGREFYVYDLETYKLEKIADNTTDWFTVDIVKWDSNSLCISGYDQQGTETILVDLISKTVTLNSRVCHEFFNEYELKYEDEFTYKALVNELKLPPSYKLVIE